MKKQTQYLITKVYLTLQRVSLEIIENFNNV